MLRRYGGATGLSTALVLLSAACSSSSTTTPTVADPATPAVELSTNTKVTVGKGLVPLAADALGTPRLVRATRHRAAPASATVEEAARFHLRELAPIWGASAKRVGEATASGVTRLNGGASIVSLTQRVDGVEVFGGDLRVMLASDRSLTAISGSLISGDPGKPRFNLTAADALTSAVAAGWQVNVRPSSMAKGNGAWTMLHVPPAGDLVIREAAAKRVMAPAQPGSTALVAAYQVEVFASSATSVDGEGFRYLIAADNGRVLEKHDLTQHETFNYRVFAKDDGDLRPFDGPTESYLPHPTGTPDGFEPAFADPNLIPVESLNTPHDVWLAADATETVGNNVDAYVDYTAPDGLTVPGDFRANTTSALTFDRVYDTDGEPTVSQDQSKAAITNLFYVINWLHDYFYDSGFDESARVAQADNYGRGGADAVAGDSMKAEAQDGAFAGSRNNANMNTPSDGLRPRMQMFLWAGADIERTLTVAGVEHASNTAGWGPRNFDLTAEAVLVDDGVSTPAPGSTSDACQTPFANAAAVAGKIAVLDRGNCNFTVKVQNAQANGAVGVILVNNAANQPAPGLGGTPTAPITIPTLSTTLEAGVIIKTAIATPGTNATLHRVAQVEVDGDLDNGIISHEWGHYFHHRLTNCTTTQCAAESEGWGDFIALHTLINAEDVADLDGATFSTAGYAGRGITENAFFYGIRRYPYTHDTAINPLSFQHIQASATLPASPPPHAGGPNNEVHNAGEIWTLMLYEAYRAVLDAHPFEDARRRMADYIVAGLIMAPVNATYTETRDSILLAASTLHNGEDVTAMAEAFAFRGAGTCAVSPDRFSTTFEGVIESTTLAGNLTAGGFALTENNLTLCDNDGYLDPGELGTIHVTVANAGPAPLAGVVVDAESTNPGVEITAPVNIGTMDPYESIDLEIPVRVALSTAPDSSLGLTITATAADGCTPSVAADIEDRVGVDDVLAVSATDTFEAKATPWTARDIVGPEAAELWGRGDGTVGDHALLGADAGEASDSAFETPVLTIDAAAAGVTVTFDHAYSFEADAPPGTGMYDGGMIEVSTDGGTTWVDATTLTTTPIAYTGALFSGSGNPQQGRQAFGRNSTGYPNKQTLALDFGTNLSTFASFQLRFRIATDASVGAPGWEIDNLAVTGITNTPFNAVQDEPTPSCQIAPIADAGPDQTVDPADVVQLAGVANDPNGETVVIAWTQLAGPPVTLSSTTVNNPTFTAPDVTVDRTVRLEMTVTDSFFTSSDTVDILIEAPPVTPPDAGVPDAAVPDAAPTPPDAEPPSPDAEEEPDAAPNPGDGDGDGCGCRTSSRSDALGLLVPFAMVGLALRRRRKVTAKR
jgi:large repetitive protein